MRTFISKLFGYSPFQPLQEHMKKSKECMELLPELFEAFFTHDKDKLMDVKSRICRIEHEADEIKNAIRDHIPKGLFLTVQRGDFMAMLKVQDRFPDTVEDIAILFTLRDTACPEFLVEPMKNFIAKVSEAFNLAFEVVDQLNNLIASSFSGPECQKTLDKINRLGHIEWEADNIQTGIAREIFKHEDEIDILSILFLNSILKNLGSLANHAESIGDRMRVLMAS